MLQNTDKKLNKIDTNDLSVVPQNPQSDWLELFNTIADTQEHELLLNTKNTFDKEEWTW